MSSSSGGHFDGFHPLYVGTVWCGVCVRDGPVDIWSIGVACINNEDIPLSRYYTLYDPLSCVCVCDPMWACSPLDVCVEYYDYN